MRILRWDERLVPVGSDEYDLYINAVILPELPVECVNIAVEIGGARA
ncbi:hypothetical protein ACQKK5_07910 [Brevibacillus panacihumi]